METLASRKFVIFSHKHKKLFHIEEWILTFRLRICNGTAELTSLYSITWFSFSRVNRFSRAEIGGGGIIRSLIHRGNLVYPPKHNNLNIIAFNNKLFFTVHSGLKNDGSGCKKKQFKLFTFYFFFYYLEIRKFKKSLISKQLIFLFWKQKKVYFSRFWRYFASWVHIFLRLRILRSFKVSLKKIFKLAISPKKMI